MQKRTIFLAVVLVLVAVSISSVFAQEPCAAVQPESCVVCHKGAGADHQASYDELYQDGVITVTDLAYEFSGPGTHIVTFQMTKDGAPVDARDVESLGIYFVPYTGQAFQFEPAADRLSLKGALSYDGAGGCTSTLVADAPDVSNTPGLIVVYGRDESVGRLPARVYQNRYPFAALLETGAGVDYVSAANNAGCVKCHTDPYLKHGYIYAQVDRDATTDFYTCKACHLDNGEGGHFEWQLLVDDPEKAVEWLNSDEDLSIFTPEQLAQLAYTTSLMNDVHMSHAMEFPYPQSMANCVTCHEGKLNTVLSDNNFIMETCKSCHPMTGSEEYGTAELALKTIIPHDISPMACKSCHKRGGIAPAFSDIHSGYDKVIYADAAGTKYSDAIVVTIDDTSVADNVLTIEFSAAVDPKLAGFAARDIVPTLLVGLYGYDTKDFIVGPHRRDADRNRLLEAEVGLPDAGHPRITTLSAPGSGGGTGGSGSWVVTADLSMWADLIADGTVKRAEIGITAELENAAGVELAINAVSRTFDLGSNDFDDGYFSPIVDIEGCHNCHEALATNYHSPKRGGSITVCRMCHITLDDGSHLEMQSRSLDSYVHAIHQGQAFDIGDVNFADPVEALHYDHHIGFPYPTHGITNCESCHFEGTYEVPDQSKSLPGRASESDEVATWDRNIGFVPSYVTGPASRACGSCHRAEMINEDDVGELISFNQHTKQGGYLIEVTDEEDDENEAEGVLATVIDCIMSLFK
ncbi:cytochrome c3 family protein [Planctomycetota bacterium]